MVMVSSDVGDGGGGVKWWCQVMVVVGVVVSSNVGGGGDGVK